MEQKEHSRGEILSTKIAIFNWIILSKYKQKECADKKNKQNVVYRFGSENE